MSWKGDLKSLLEVWPALEEGCLRRVAIPGGFFTVGRMNSAGFTAGGGFALRVVAREAVVVGTGTSFIFLGLRGIAVAVVLISFLG